LIELLCVSEVFTIENGGREDLICCFKVMTTNFIQVQEVEGLKSYRKDV
jgi:hypothetical protein